MCLDLLKKSSDTLIEERARIKGFCDVINILKERKENISHEKV